MAQPIEEFAITSHAAFEMQRRGIDKATLQRVLDAPEQRETVRPGRDVLQSRIDFGGKPCLVRVFVDVDRRPPEVVTVYRTSKIEKYWRHKP
jgi:hypothetical protein